MVNNRGVVNLVIPSQTKQEARASQSFCLVSGGKLPRSHLEIFLFSSTGLSKLASVPAGGAVMASAAAAGGGGASAAGEAPAGQNHHLSLDNHCVCVLVKLYSDYPLHYV